jgi:hypothetical protein
VFGVRARNANGGIILSDLMINAPSESVPRLMRLPALNRIVKEDGAPAPAAYDEISPWRGRLN